MFGLQSSAGSSLDLYCFDDIQGLSKVTEVYHNSNCTPKQIQTQIMKKKKNSNNFES